MNTSSLTRMILLFLLDLSVKTALFAAAAELLLRLVDTRDTILRHTAWVAVLGGMLALPLCLLLPGLTLRLSFVHSPAEVATATPPATEQLLARVPPPAFRAPTRPL